MDDVLRNGFVFGAIRASPAEGWIEGPHGVEYLDPTQMAVLVCLARRPGEVVEPSAILAEVWHGRPDGDAAVGRCIDELRRALHDDADEAAYVETVPDRGYRLIPAVVPIDRKSAFSSTAARTNSLRRLWDDLKERKVVRVAIAYAAASWVLLQLAQLLRDALDLPNWILTASLFLLGVGFLVAVVVAWLYQLVPERDAPAFVQRPRFKQAVDIAIIAFLAVAVGLLALRQLGDRSIFPSVAALPASVTTPRPADKSIAVLRFASFGADAAFSNGLGEHLLNLLARVGDLQVPSRQVTWMLSDQNLDPRRIGEELRVRYLLEGSVQQSDERIRVTAQLIDASSGNHVWSESYDEVLSADNFFSIQDAIAQQVVTKLESTLSEASIAGFGEQGTRDDEALRHYLNGRRLLNEPKTEATMTAAVAAFDAAAREDPHFAEAYAGLCDAQLAWYVTYLDTRYFDAAESACIRALRIDADLGEVYAALGSLHRHSGQLDDAESELLQAARLLNRPAHVLEELGRTYQAGQKLVLAEQTFNEAIVKEPANWSVYRSMGNFLFRTGRYAEALPYFKQVLVMQRDSAAAYTNIGAAFFMLGDFSNASVAWGQSLELEPSHAAYMNHANSLYYQGRYAESVEMYRNAIEIGANDARAWGGLGASCAQVAAEVACRNEAFARAIELLDESLAINPLDADALSRAASYYARTDQKAEALETLDALSELDWENPDVPYFVALAYAALGDTTAAITYINRAVIMGYPRVLAAADPGFSGIRGEPEFVEISAAGLK